MNAIGVIAGLATACCWTVTATCFEQAGKRIGSLPVNVIRLVFALSLFVALSFVKTGAPFEPNAGSEAWIYLSLSGLVGFVLGDLLLFKAFVLIGSRLSMLIYASVPIITAAIGYFFLRETMRLSSIGGMVLTVAGIALAVLGKPRAGGAAPENRPKSLRLRTLGILLAFGGSLGQAGGLVLGKKGSFGLDSFAATEIRAIAGLAGFFLIAFATRRFAEVLRPFRVAFFADRLGAGRRIRGEEKLGELDRKEAKKALAFTLVGAVLGPFLGVSLGLLSAQLTTAGAASTLMSIVPVIIIPVAVFVFKEKVGFLEVLGALIAVAGVAVLAF